MGMKNNSFSKFSNAELRHAIELMIAPEDLGERQVMIAILKAMDFTEQEVADQLADNEYLHSGPHLVWKF